MNHLISIIVPIYNEEKYLNRCIESILRQTHKNIQLILINDGSKDKSLDICHYYKSIDNRIVIVDIKNGGVSAARNYGLKLAMGDLIGFVDSDDYIEENMYETLLNRIIEDDSQACVLTLASINSFTQYRAKYQNNIIDKDEAIKHLFHLSFPVSLCAYLYKKEVVANIWLNEEIHFFEDFEFTFRALNNLNIVSMCHEKLYNYIINAGSINSREINDKRITCLNIYENTIITIRNKNSKFEKNAMYYRAHFLISVIASTAKSIKANEKYYRIVRKNARDMLWDIMFSKFVPIKYKVAILISSMNPYLFCRTLYIFKYKK